MANTGPEKPGKDDRNERLKQALRANLRRRKTQTKQKQQKDKPADPKER